MQHRFRGIEKLPDSEKYRVTIEIFGKKYRSESFDDALSAAMLYDALCKVLRRDSRRNFPSIETHGRFTKIAQAIYRRARNENPEAVRKKQSLASIKARIRPYERSDREKIIIETAQTAGMQHAAANPAMPLVDTTLKASVLTHKLGVKDPDTATRLMMTQFPWTTTLKERQLYWRAFARGCEKIVLNRRKRGVSAAEAAQIAASF